MLEGECPDCEGIGYVSGEETYAACCRNENSDGSCCGIPVPEAEQVQIPCETCQTTGKILIQKTKYNE